MSYEPCYTKKNVQTADGTLLKVTGISNIRVALIGLLTHVLHVPKLSVSLRPFQKIAKMDEYKIIFDDVDAFLCNKFQGWRIGLAEVLYGLYYLSHTTLSPQRETKFKITMVTNTYTKD